MDQNIIDSFAEISVDETPINEFDLMKYEIKTIEDAETRLNELREMLDMDDNQLQQLKTDWDEVNDEVEQIGKWILKYNSENII